MRRRAGICAVVALAGAALAAPAGAQAARYTVKPGGGACGGGDRSCGTLSAAARAMRVGDALKISAGRYAESPRFSAAGLVVRGSKTAPGVVIEGTVTFAGDGRLPSVLERLVVRAAVPDAPAVNVRGTAGLALRDASLFSAAGDTLTITGPSANAVTRSRLLAGRAAVAIGGGSVALDSSILGGGASDGGAGVRVDAAAQYAIGTTPSVVARHVTIAGAPTAIGLLGVANVSVTDSIVLGTAPAGVRFTRTDRTSAPERLFVNPATRNFRLRPGSPAIDRGQITSGDSATDVDGQPRTLGRASDLGADELDSVAPRVTLTQPRAGRPLAARSRLRLAGRATDPSGVAAVLFSLEVLPRSGSSCAWFHPARALVTRSCSDPVLVRAKLTTRGRWSYLGPRAARLPGGRYRVQVSGSDSAGVTGNSAPTRRGVTFRVRGAAAAR